MSGGVDHKKMGGKLSERELATHLPQPTLCTLERAGHFPFIEAADRFR
jgi:hypothetical protein